MTDFIKNLWVYDLETYPNIFTFCSVYGNGKGIRVFEISDRKDDTEELMDFIRNLVKHGHKLGGYNNVGFDYPIVHHMIEKAKKCKRRNITLKFTAQELYEKANEIINSESRFANIVKPSEVVVPQVDAYKIMHFDNAAKATSLKMLEFNMRSPNIEDLPFAVGTELNDEEKDILIKYNKHDVMETLKFINHIKGDIKLREDLSKKLGFDVSNHNDAKIGSDLFINRLEKESPGICYKKSRYKREMRQTKRDSIDLGDVILDYVEFERPEFQAVKQWFEQQIIKETKGVFTDILESDLGDVANYANMRTKRQRFKGKPSDDLVAKMRKDKPLLWVEEQELKSKKGAKSYWYHWNVADNLNVVVDGLQYDFGTGGLHGAIESGIYESDENEVYIDVDVASYYPNLSIQNELYPQHLGITFCKIYKDLYEERKQYAKGTPENYALKIALNGSYGKSNDKYSPLYDPKFTMAITINGQLLLCKLAEMLMNVGAKIVYLNTDGLTYKIPRNKADESRKAYQEWEKLTKLELEEVIYDKMFLRDVNNYIMVTDSGKVKRKGAYEYDGLGWHQNHSSLVITMAVEHELLGKGSAKDFIRSHKDEYDFMLRTKVPRSSRLVMKMEDGSEVLQQNICRYYACKEGGKLVKIMPPLEKKTTKYWKHEDGSVKVTDSAAQHTKMEKLGYEEVDLTFKQAITIPKYLKEMERHLGIDTEWNVKTCNNMIDFDWNIDYDYYIEGARKLIDVLLDTNPKT